MNKLKFRYTLPGQLCTPLKNHATTTLFFSLMWFMTINLWTSRTGQIIFSSLGLLVYFLAIYGAGYETCLDDKKPYSCHSPKWYRGIYLPIFLTIVNVLVIIIYKCSWAFGTTDGYISNGWALTGNILAVLWYAPYKGLLGMNQGHFELQGYLIIILLPYIATFLGYLAGYKNFDIYAKLNSFAYEKKK